MLRSFKNLLEALQCLPGGIKNGRIFLRPCFKDFPPLFLQRMGNHGKLDRLFIQICHTSVATHAFVVKEGIC